VTDAELLQQAADWLDAGRGVALATVERTWGSSPRGVGSQLVVNDRGEFAGSVSGGCVEAAVVEGALEVLRTGAPRRLAFGVTNERAWEVGLACGGTVEVAVSPAPERAVLASVLADVATRRTAILSLTLPGGGRLERIFAPPIRVVVIGAVHAAQALVPMIGLAGYHPIVIDPRPAFASAARFPGVQLLTEWPEAALPRVALDRHTALVALTHDPRIDEPALAAALGSEAFYVGALGSRKTHAARCARLGALGLDAAAVARVHGPIGLDLGAEGPGEIAVAILAELVAALRRPGAPWPARRPEAAPDEPTRGRE
jgi:xanthine dehydrogenase accessory factor